MSQPVTTAPTTTTTTSEAETPPTTTAMYPPPGFGYGPPPPSAQFYSTPPFQQPFAPSSGFPFAPMDSFMQQQQPVFYDPYAMSMQSQSDAAYWQFQMQQQQQQQMAQQHFSSSGYAPSPLFYGNQQQFPFQATAPFALQQQQHGYLAVQPPPAGSFAAHPSSPGVHYVLQQPLYLASSQSGGAETEQSNGGGAGGVFEYALDDAGRKVIVRRSFRPDELEQQLAHPQMSSEEAALERRKLGAEVAEFGNNNDVNDNGGVARPRVRRARGGGRRSRGSSVAGAAAAADGDSNAGGACASGRGSHHSSNNNGGYSNPNAEAIDIAKVDLHDVKAPEEPPYVIFVADLDEHMTDTFLLKFFNRNNLKDTTIIPNNNNLKKGGPASPRPPARRGHAKVSLPSREDYDHAMQLNNTLLFEGDATKPLRIATIWHGRVSSEYKLGHKAMKLYIRFRKNLNELEAKEELKRYQPTFYSLRQFVRPEQNSFYFVQYMSYTDASKALQTLRADLRGENSCIQFVDWAHETEKQQQQPSRRQSGRASRAGSDSEGSVGRVSPGEQVTTVLRALPFADPSAVTSMATSPSEDAPISIPSASSRKSASPAREESAAASSNDESDEPVEGFDDDDRSEEAHPIEAPRREEGARLAEMGPSDHSPAAPRNEIEGRPESQQQAVQQQPQQEASRETNPDVHSEVQQNVLAEAQPEAQPEP